MSQQWVLIEPAPMEGVERTNEVMVCPQQRVGFAQRRDPNIMEIDRERNCYAYGGFGYMTQYCRNRERIRDRKRLDYRQRIKENYGLQNNLKEKENLGTFT